MSEALAAIKKLYYGTNRRTIERDFDQAIDLLKSMPDEDERERAAVFMDGLAEMKRQWVATRPERASDGRRSGAARARSGQSTGGGRRSR